MKDFITSFLKDFYYLVLIPFLSIFVFFIFQFLTKGLEYFINKGRIRWGFLAFMAILQFFVSCLVTWSVLSIFASDFLSEYDTLKMSAMIIIGGAPFNITMLIWVALKLEIYRLMKERYGDDFLEDSILKKIESEDKKGE